MVIQKTYNKNVFDINFIDGFEYQFQLGEFPFVYVLIQLTYILTRV